ncbi:MAG: hypothetical protein IT578_10690 [Verrucomicrobiae bacterium]|nr:hypothetical protein [Verrucomicrobiae bacterium]
MMFPKHFRAAVIGIVAAFFAAAASARAIVLDWSALTWTPGSLTNSYDIDPNNPGHDITITISGNVSALGNDTLTGDPTPDISTFKEGGQSSPIQPSLAFLVDFANKNQAITVTIDFNYQNGVDTVSYYIFDIDVGNASGSKYTYVDQIRSIWGQRLDGAIMGATTLTNGPAVTLAGSGTNRTATANTRTVPDSGSGSGAGNLYVSYGTNVVNSIQFTYGSGANAQNNPATQAISLFNIEYRVVPEMNALYGTSAVVLATLAALTWRRRRRQSSFS